MLGVGLDVIDVDMLYFVVGFFFEVFGKFCFVDEVWKVMISLCWVLFNGNCGIVFVQILYVCVQYIYIKVEKLYVV